MIQEQDRSGWFGASDTARIMGRWDTKTFKRFWAEKLGLRRNSIKTIAMQTGTAYEHRILDAMGIVQRDRQIKIPELRLKVNLDGEDEIIHEIKTHKSMEFRLSSAYIQQAQVEMYAANKPLEIDAYKLLEQDYRNYFNPIDLQRLTRHFVAYDRDFIEKRYLPRLEYLADRLKKEVWPNDRDMYCMWG